MGNTHVNKLLAALNVPYFTWNSYKTHEKEVGKAVEDIAHQSCLAAAREERRLTIENADKLKKFLWVVLLSEQGYCITNFFSCALGRMRRNN